jgi:RNA polymerase sigma-70 factor (ECF subfamily)
MNSNERDPVSATTLPLPVNSSAESLERLFSAHYCRVLLAAYRITGNMADAEDVAQGVFLRLRSQDEAVLRNEASYLYRAAINGALDLRRRQRIAGADPLEAAEELQSSRPADSPDTNSSRRETQHLLRQAISELPARAAEMFTLRYLEELGNREIARMMGTSQAVVAVTLHNARSRLKKRLQELERGMR